jgi:transcriptional regulator NrdR family protein
VKKRSGNTEPFDPRKIKRSIQKAAIDAGCTIEQMAIIDKVTAGIVEESGKKDEIDTKTIRNNILNRLEQVGSSIATSWRKFEEKYKY